MPYKVIDQKYAGLLGKVRYVSDFSDGFIVDYAHLIPIMMKEIKMNRYSCLSFVVIFSLFVGRQAAGEPTTQPVIPQAKPLIDLLNAMKDSDADKFRDSFVKEIREAKQPWAEKVKQAAKVYIKLYGDYDVADFKFEYNGDDKNGAVTMTYKDIRPKISKVTKEGDDWKLANH